MHELERYLFYREDRHNELNVELTLEQLKEAGYTNILLLSNTGEYWIAQATIKNDKHVAGKGPTINIALNKLLDKIGEAINE